MGVREHEQPSQALALVWLCPKSPGPVGHCAALLREAGREQQLPGAAEAKLALPAHLSKVLGVSEHKGGQSPWVLDGQPRTGLGSTGMWDLVMSPCAAALSV